MKQSAIRLVTGQREPVKVVIPSGRDVGPVAGATARRIFADSNEVAELFMQDSMRWRIVPNTYEMWWETDVNRLANRILREHEAWWNEDRLAAARALGLNPREVTVLASIVQAETAVIQEAPQVAGLYLNRLKKGMALQADPTLIFALNDPSIRRVLDVHKEVDSPYNTYKHRGLPPAPFVTWTPGTFKAYCTLLSIVSCTCAPNLVAMAPTILQGRTANICATPGLTKAG